MPVTAPDVVAAEEGLKGWRVFLDAPRILATPAVHNGRIFVGGGYGSHHFYALDAATGATVWQIKTDDDGPTAAVVVGGIVAFNTESCTLIAVEADTGKVLWSKWLGDPLMGQPAADAERVWMAYPNKEGKHRMACFALRTGAPLWETEVGHDVISAPVIDADAVYVSTFDGKVTCLDASTGNVRWSEDRGATSAPWVIEGKVYVSQHEDRTAIQDRTRDRVESVREYKSASGALNRTDTVRISKAEYLKEDSNPKLSGVFDRMDSEVGFAKKPDHAKLNTAASVTGNKSVAGCWAYQGSRPAVVDGRCYSTVGDVLECVELASGRGIWKHEPPLAQGSGRVFTPPVVANNKVFVGTVHGRMRALDAKTGAQLWRYRTRAPVRFPPAVWAGRVIFGNDRGEVICIETGDAADTGWPMWGGGPGHNGPTK